MADDLDLGSVGLSTQAAERAILSLNSKFTKMNATIVQFTEVAYKFDKAGKLVEAAIQGITKQGDVATATIVKTAKGWDANVASITKVIPKVNDAIKAWLGLSKALTNVAAAQAKIDKDQYNKIFSSLGKVAQRQELDEFKAAKRAQALADRQFDRLLKNLGRIAQAQELEDFRKAQREQALADKNFNKAMANLGKVAAAQQKLNEQASRTASSERAAGRLKSALPLSGNVDNAGVVKFDASVAKLVAGIAKGNISMQDFFKVVRAVMSGTTNSLTQAEQIYAQRIQQVITLQQKLNSQANGQVSAVGLERALQNQFPVNNIRASASEINRLQSAIAKATQTVASGKVSLTQFNSVLTQIKANGATTFQGVEREAANAIRSVIAAHKNLGAESDRTTNGMLLSWQSFGRLLTVQFAHSVVAGLINSFKEGIREAAQFQVKISEIRTVAQDNQRGFDEWSDSIRRLSDEFGSSLIDVAIGGYETLSNQVVDSTAQFQTFSREVQKFSVATVSSTKDSVNLLTSALNSFKIATDDVNRVAAVFFKTIDLGRVRADEMADTFGRMGPLASTVGVSFEEVNAAIDTLTIRGTRFNDAATLINNIILQLLKPSTEMKDLLQEWGVTTGEAAIATFGFGGVLQKLEGESKKGTTRLAELFNEMRALRGIISLTGDAFDDFNFALEESKNAVDDYENAVKIGMESAGKKLQIEVNKIKNFFTVDLGTDVLNNVQAFSDTIGVKLSDAVISVAKAGAGTAATLGTFFTVLTIGTAVVNSARFGLIAYTLQLITTGHATVGLTGVTRSLTLAIAANPVVAVIAGIAAGLAYVATSVAATNAKIKSAIQDYKAEQAEIDAEITQGQQREVNERFQNFKEGLEKQFRLFAQYAAGVNSANFALTKQLAKQLEVSQESFKNIYKLALDQIKKNVDEIEGRVKTARNEMEEAENRSKDIGKSFEQKSLRQELQFAQPADQILIIRQRIADLQADYVKLNAAGKIPEAREALDEMGDLFFELGDKAGNAFKDTNDEVAKLNKLIADNKDKINKGQFNIGNTNGFGTQNRNLRDIVELNQEINDAQQRLQDIKKDQVKNGVDYAALQAEQVAHNAEMLKFEQDAAAAAAARLATEEALLKAQEQRKKLAVNSFSDLEKFNTDLAGGQFGNDKQAALNAFDKVADNLKLSLQGADPAQVLALYFRLGEQRQVIAKQIEAKITEDTIAEAQRRSELIRAAAVEAAEKYKSAMLEAQQVVTTSLSEAGGTVEKLKASMTKLLDGNAASKGFRAQTINKQELEPLLKLLENAKLKPTEESFDAIDAAVRNLNKSVKNSPDFIKLIGEIGKARRAFVDAGTNKEKLEAATGEAEKLAEKLRKSLPKAWQDEAAAATESGDQTIDVIKAASAAVDDLILKVKDLDKAFRTVRPPSMGGGALPVFERGGLVMGPGGRDNVFARLTRNEFVMNERATRAHYPTLVAMNSRGKAFAQGGSVTNSVGDVNITVNGGSTSEATVRNIGKGIRREFRRGNLRPFNN